MSGGQLHTGRIFVFEENYFLYNWYAINKYKERASFYIVTTVVPIQE